MDELIKQVQRNIREEEIQYFTPEEIGEYLIEFNNDVRETSYQLLVIKSENTSLQVSGLTTQDTSKYFLRIAARFRRVNSGVI